MINCQLCKNEMIFSSNEYKSYCINCGNYFCLISYDGTLIEESVSFKNTNSLKPALLFVSGTSNNYVQSDEKMTTIVAYYQDKEWLKNSRILFEYDLLSAEKMAEIIKNYIGK